MTYGTGNSSTPAIFHCGVRSLCASLVAASLLLWPSLDAVSAGTFKDKKPKQDPALKGLPISELNPDEAIQHALNRLAYGPRPGDIERIRKMGLARWIDLQLNPNSIDDKALESRLENLPSIRMSTAALIRDYPQPKQAAKSGTAQAVNSQPLSRADAAAAVIARDSGASGAQASRLQPSNAQSSSPGADQSASSGDDAPSPMKQPSGNAATPGAGRTSPLSVDPNAVPRIIADDSRRPARVVEELAMAKMARAVYSERQLQQVMDDFWFNHFNVFAGSRLMNGKSSSRTRSASSKISSPTLRKAPRCCFISIIS